MTRHLGYDKAGRGLPPCQINTPAEPLHLAEPLDIEISQAGGKPLAEVTSSMPERRVDHKPQCWPMKRRDTPYRSMKMAHAQQWRPI